jgi:hypothetical protein
MIHISWPFWTPELRRVIRKLKAEGKLREEPLLYLDKGIAKNTFILMGLFCLPVIITGNNLYNTNEIIYFGILYVICIAITIIYSIRKAILPYTIGCPINAYIVSPVKYGQRTIKSGRCWFFDYAIEDKKAPKEIQGKAFQANGIPKKTPDLFSLAEGDQIIVMVHPNFPKNNFPYFASKETILRLTTDPIEIEGDAS